MAGRYKVYPEYKHSGVEWVGYIPSHWTLARLKNVLKIRNGKDYKEVEVSSGGYPVYGSGGIFKYSSTFLYDGESVLFGRKGTIDKPLLVKGKFWTVDTMFYSEVCSKMDARFIHNQAMLFPYDLLSTNTALPSMTQEDLLELGFVFPGYEEQQKIANFLDLETAKIDTLIAKQEKLIELLKEKRQAVISHAVTKGLNPDVRMKDSGVEWLGEVPEHWVVLKLKHLIQSLESGCSVNAADTPAKTGEFGVLKTSCVYTRCFRVEENKTVLQEDLPRVKCPIRKGAIIISRMNTPELVGASALVNVDIDNIYLPDRLWQTNFNKSFDIEAEFLAYFMTVEGFRNQISLSAEGASSSMQNIAKEDYLAINAILPQLKEQIEIVNYIKKNEAKFLRLEAQVMNTIELLKERKTALISAAVTGKIDVRDWQPKGIQ